MLDTPGIKALVFIVTRSILFFPISAVDFCLTLGTIIKLRETHTLLPTLNWIGKDAVIHYRKEVPFRLLKCRADLSVGDPLCPADISPKYRRAWNLGEETPSTPNYDDRAVRIEGGKVVRVK